MNHRFRSFYLVKNLKTFQVIIITFRPGKSGRDLFYPLPASPAAWISCRHSSDWAFVILTRT